jgi:hypothetical protein
MSIDTNMDEFVRLCADKWGENNIQFRMVTLDGNSGEFNAMINGEWVPLAISLADFDDPQQLVKKIEQAMA